ncbi:MAG: SDR family oxidoreductase [Spirochaetales bacterium]|nr:SDR family oxidoreductase [Spirochaetales bacterium]
MQNILVLGASGMLGSMVFHYLSQNKNFSVYGTVRNRHYIKKNIVLFDAGKVNDLEMDRFAELKIDYIINCIGITKPFCKDNDPEGVYNAININASFPWKLADFCLQHDINIIQIATDCVYSGKEGGYTEQSPHDPLDVYGKTKSLGEVFRKSTLNIRSSIIGPEPHGCSHYLLEWFLQTPDNTEVNGFEHHEWNGVMTLQFAQLCEKIIESDFFSRLLEVSPVHHFIPNSLVTKYELLQILKRVFKKNIIINKVNKPEQKVLRTLNTVFPLLEQLFPRKEMDKAIVELKHYMDEYKLNEVFI